MIKFLLFKISRYLLRIQNHKKIIQFLSINNNKNILVLCDVGCAGGLEPRWKLFEKYIRTILFEPDIRSSTELKNKGLKVIEKALWSETLQKKFYLTKNLGASSLYKPNKLYLDFFPDSERLVIVDVIKIDVSKMDNLIDSKNHPNFIKLDAQGAELEILKGSTNILKNVLGLEIEVSFKKIYKKIPLAYDVEKFLNSQGFVLNDFLTFIRWERTLFRGFGEIVFGNALFLRTPEKIIEISKHLTNPISLFENYVKILFIYNKLDLIIKLSENISNEQKKLLNLNSIILILEKNHKKLYFYNKLFGYFTRFFISNDIMPHLKL